MKNLIDYAYADNGTDFRAELYAAIHDKVAAAIEGKKQEIASGLMGQQFEEEFEEDEEHYRSRQAKDEKAAPSEESHEEKMARKKLNKEEYEALDELSTKAYQKYTSSATGPHNMERLFKGSPKQAQASAGIKRASAGIESNKLKELQNHIGSDKETAIVVGNRVKEFLGKSYDHNDDLHRKAALQIHKRLGEEVESLDEISVDKIVKYSDKAQKSYADPETSPEKKANRMKGLTTGYQKLKARAKVPATYGEEVE